MSEPDIFDFVMATYANEPCRICRRNIEPEDTRGLVFTGYTDVDGKVSRTSHGQCWRDLSPEEKQKMQAEHLASLNGGPDGT